MNSHIAAVIAAERGCDVREDVARGRVPRAADARPRRTLRERLAARWRCASAPSHRRSTS
jgi:hypothetical protein